MTALTADGRAFHVRAADTGNAGTNKYNQRQEIAEQRRPQASTSRTSCGDSATFLMFFLSQLHQYYSSRTRTCDTIQYDRTISYDYHK